MFLLASVAIEILLYLEHFDHFLLYHTLENLKSRVDLLDAVWILPLALQVGVHRGFGVRLAACRRLEHHNCLARVGIITVPDAILKLQRHVLRRRGSGGCNVLMV